MNSQLKKLFITGGTGYIGRAIIKEFLNNNWKVTALTRDNLKGKELEKLGCEYILGDLGDIQALEKGASNADGIIHCARDKSGTQEANEKDLIAINTFISTAKEIASASNKPVTFVYTSGCLTIGEGDDIKDEYSLITTPHPYAKWRFENEQKVLQYTDNTKNLTTVVIRPSWVYGSGAGSISNYLRVCKKDQFVYYVGDGESYCNFIHTRDLAKLYFLLTDQNESGIFHATDNNYLTVNEIVFALKSYLKCDSKNVDFEEGKKLFGFGVYSQIVNQKIVTQRSLEIGWKPDHESFISNLDELFNELS